MFVLEYKLVVIEPPRMATTFLRGFFHRYLNGTNHVGHMHSAGHCNQFQLPTAMPIQDPERWYPSFWSYFVEPPPTIKIPDELRQSHLNVASGLGFKGWLERVTIGSAVDMADPFLLPVSPRGLGQGAESFPHDFWMDKLHRGGGLFSYIFRHMKNPDTEIFRVCDLPRELLKVLLRHDIEVSDEAIEHLNRNEPVNEGQNKPELDDEMRHWIYTAEASIYDDYRPDVWNERE